MSSQCADHADLMNGCEQIERTNGLWYWAEYSTFSITDEASQYVNTMNGYSGNAQNAVQQSWNGAWKTNGMKFTTPDRDNDNAPRNCGSGGGWWHNWCGAANLNGDTIVVWKSNAVRDIQRSRMLLKLN